MGGLNGSLFFGLSAGRIGGHSGVQSKKKRRMIVRFDPFLISNAVAFLITTVWLTANEGRGAKVKYRDPFPPEHGPFLPDIFKQRLGEIAANEYLTGEARIDLVDKVYDKLPKSILIKLPLDPPIYQLPLPTQRKFRALMVDRSLGWRRRAQLYDQLVDSLPNNYRKMMMQYAKSGGKSSSSSSSSSTSESMGDPENDPEMQNNGNNDFNGAGGP